MLNLLVTMRWISLILVGGGWSAQKIYSFNVYFKTWYGEVWKESNITVDLAASNTEAKVYYSNYQGNIY
jgi:hypothetical protein